MISRVSGFVSAALLVTSVAACSSTSQPAAPAAGTSDAAAPTEDPSAAEAGAPATETCAPPPSKSTCGDNAWVRGTARFDPTLVAAGAKPVLRIALRHNFALVKGEETIGGRLHGYVSVPVKDPTLGEIPFAIDMCDFGTSMWSEENGAFHLVLILDMNGDNDLANATTNDEAVVIGTPSKGEYVKMVDVDVSCKAAAACVDVKLDCTGASCLTFAPVKSCAKKLPGCGSDSSFCN